MHLNSHSADTCPLPPLTCSDLYAKAKPYLENEWFIKSTGFKTLPETINGRAAMVGFLAAAGAEIFGQGPFLAQLSSFPQPPLVIMALITAGSIIPVYKVRGWGRRIRC